MKKIKGNLKFRGAAVSISKEVRQSSKKFKLLLYQIFCRRLISGRGIVNGRVSYLTICWDSALNPKICKFSLPILYCRVAILYHKCFEFSLSLFYFLYPLPGCNLTLDTHFRVEKKMTYPNIFFSIYFIFTSGLRKSWSLFNVFFSIYSYLLPGWEKKLVFIQCIFTIYLCYFRVEILFTIYKLIIII